MTDIISRGFRVSKKEELDPSKVKTKVDRWEFKNPQGGNLRTLKVRNKEISI